MALGTPEDDRDLYAVLGLHRSAPPAEVTRAYRRLVLALHPDTRPVHTPAENDAADAQIAAVIAAYEVLGDPARRDTYDRALQPEQQHATDRGGVPIRVRVVRDGPPRHAPTRPTAAWSMHPRRDAIVAAWPAGAGDCSFGDVFALLERVLRR